MLALGNGYDMNFEPTKKDRICILNELALDLVLYLRFSNHNAVYFFAYAGAR